VLDPSFTVKFCRAEDLLALDLIPHDHELVQFGSINQGGHPLT
jgi:hypothetical protein